MTSKIHVVEIKELYKLIPESRSLEHKNFSDLKELLIELTNSIEKNTNWEFIQYINNKPSIFIVRERFDVESETPMYDNKIHNDKSYLQNKSIPDEYEGVTIPEEDTFYSNTKQNSETVISYGSDTLGSSKLPWED